MGDTTAISWCDKTFNPWMGCTKVSPACAQCYAERDMDKRYGKVKWGPSGTRVKTSPQNWKVPLKWNREAQAAGVRYRVFCASLADVFEDWGGDILGHRGDTLFACPNCQHVDRDDDVDGFCERGDGLWRCPACDAIVTLRKATLDDLRTELFALIDATPHLDWLLLTKRPENIRKMLVPHSLERVKGHVSQNEGDGYLLRRRNNLWLGATVENQEYADQRIPALLECRDLSPVLFLSCEPLLGPVNVAQFLEGGRIDWVIAGGESGPNARPSHSDWFRSLRDQCAAAGVPFHFKQWGEWAPFYDRDKDDPDWRRVPRQTPRVCRINAAGGCGFHGDRLVYFRRAGKKAAGRLLDGVEHNEFPQVETGVSRHLIHKRKLAFAIAEAIRDEWPGIEREGFDLDEATSIVDMMLPITRVEADEEIERMKGGPSNHGPSLMAQLREAMGFENGSIGDLIGRAAIRLRTHKSDRDQLIGTIEELLRMAPCECDHDVGAAPCYRCGTEKWIKTLD